MSARDRMDSADIPPGAELKIDYYNMSVPGSIEYNVDQEQLRRSEHAFANFVVTIPTLFDGDFGGGYVATSSLLVSRNTGDNATVDIQPGIAYIGGRRYKQLGEISGTTVAGSPNTDDTYYIQLRYTLSTGTFDFYASLTEQADSATVKYLTLASAVWDTTPGEWTVAAFVDLRASNTSLPPPVTFTKDDAANYILTVQNTNAALLGLYVDGYVAIGTSSKVRKIDLYGSNTVGLTIHNGASSSATLVSDNTDRIKILNNLYVPTATQLGSMTFSATTISGTITFDCGASPTFSTASGDFSWNSENFASVGAIGCTSVDASGNVQGSQLISDVVGGTAPLTVTSGTVVPTLNVDKVDGFDFDQGVLTTSSPTFVAVGITSGPTLNATGIAGATGDTITGFTSLSISGAVTAATATNTINGLVISSGTVTTGTWQGSVIANTYIADDITLTNITQITNRSHTSLSDIGSNAHSVIDSHIGASNIHYLQSNITAVGTIASGTWQGTDIAATYLGTHNHTSSDQGGDYAWADITGFGTSGTATTVSRSDHNDHDDRYYTETEQEDWPKKAHYLDKYTSGGITETTYLSYPVLKIPSLSSDWAYYFFRIPHTWNSGTSSEVVFVLNSEDGFTDSSDWYIDVKGYKPGESPSATWNITTGVSPGTAMAGTSITNLATTSGGINFDAGVDGGDLVVARFRWDGIENDQISYIYDAYITYQ